MSDSKDKDKEGKKGKAPTPKPAKKAKPKKPASKHPLPILLETTLSFSKLIILLIALSVAGISFISGATLLDIFIRTGAALLALGGLLWGLTWFVTQGYIETWQSEEREALEAQQAAAAKLQEADNSTFEVKA